MYYHQPSYSPSSNSSSSLPSGYSRIRIDESRNEYYAPSPRSSPHSSPESFTSASLPRDSPYAIHPNLQYKSTYCIPLSYLWTERDMSKMQLQYPSIAQPAMDPRALVVRIRSRDFPWQLTIQARKEVGYVTVYDVLRELFGFLQKPVTQSELSRERPERLHALGQVASARQRPMHGGYPVITRGDFLGLWSFAGLSMYTIARDGTPELLLCSRPWKG